MTDSQTDPHTVLIVAAVFILAGLVKGTIGLGLPTVAVGLLGLVMPPAHAAALLVVPSLVTNAWQLFAGPRFGGLLRRLWPMLAGIGAGTWLAAGTITAGHGAEAAMGTALIAYGLFGLMRIPLAVPPPMEPWLGPLVGLVNGAITAATGIFVLPSVPYLQALGLQREDLIQALGLSFTASTIALAVALGTSGAFPTSALTTSILALAPALLGMAAGTWLRGRVRPETFRKWFFSGLVALGADLAFSGLH
jgi:uncharacterized membrane protein YfcA